MKIVDRLLQSACSYSRIFISLWPITRAVDLIVFVVHWMCFHSKVFWVRWIQNQAIWTVWFIFISWHLYQFKWRHNWESTWALVLITIIYYSGKAWLSMLQYFCSIFASYCTVVALSFSLKSVFYLAQWST